MSETGIYNADVKNKYLQSKFPEDTTTRRNVCSTLRKVCPHEREKEKDIAFFTDFELRELFRASKWISYHTLNQRKSIIRKYILWYIGTGQKDWEQISISKGIDTINKDVFNDEDIFSEEWFLHPTELQQLFDDYFIHYENVKIYQDTVALLWMVYYGFSVEEAIQVKKQDVFTENSRAIKHPEGYYIEIEMDEARESILAYKESTVSKIKRSSGFQTAKLVDSDYLFRTYNKPNWTVNSATSAINLFSNDLENKSIHKKMKPYNVFWSGAFFRRLQLELKNGVSLTNIDSTENNIQGLETQSLKLLYLNYKNVYFNRYLSS